MTEKKDCETVDSTQESTVVLPLLSLISIQSTQDIRSPGYPRTAREPNTQKRLPAAFPLPRSPVEMVYDQIPPTPMKVPLFPSSSTRRTKYTRRRRGRNNPMYAKCEREPSLRNESTVREEEEFLVELEAYKGKRGCRTCYCESTCSYKAKTCWTILEQKINRALRACKVFCCPPCFTFPSRGAFWPPPRAYFFFRETEKTPKKEWEGRIYDREDLTNAQITRMVIDRKKTYLKLKKATREALDGTWKVGLKHACADEIENAEGVILETSCRNLIPCVRIPYMGSSARYSIIYSHPSGSDLSDHLIGVPKLRDMARFFRSDIYIYDYSGYGLSTGEANEKNQNADIRAVYDYVRYRREVPAEKIILLGYSIGTNASVDLVINLEQPPAGLILEAPPLSLLRVLTWDRGCFGRPWKNKTCCLDGFSTFDKIEKVGIKTLIIHGHDDQMVPLGHGQLIYKKAKTAVRPLWVKEFNHDTLENSQEVWKRIRIFLKYEIPGKRSRQSKMRKVVDRKSEKDSRKAKKTC